MSCQSRSRPVASAAFCPSPDPSPTAQSPSADHQLGCTPSRVGIFLSSIILYHLPIFRHEPTPPKKRGDRFGPHRTHLRAGSILCGTGTSRDSEESTMTRCRNDQRALKLTLVDSRINCGGLTGSNRMIVNQF